MKRDYVVLKVEENRVGGVVETRFTKMTTGLKSSAAAERWVKQCGAADVTYQRAALLGEPITVLITKVEKRKIESAALGEGPEA